MTLAVAEVNELLLRISGSNSRTPGATHAGHPLLVSLGAVPSHARWPAYAGGTSHVKSAWQTAFRIHK